MGTYVFVAILLLYIFQIVTVMAEEDEEYSAVLVEIRLNQQNSYTKFIIWYSWIPIMVPLMIGQIHLLIKDWTLCGICVTPRLNMVNPLVEDSIRLFKSVSTFIGAALLADSNGRRTAWISFSLHWVGSTLRLYNPLETR